MVSNLRYALIEQLHFIAGDPADPRRDVVVTIQRWKSKTTSAQVYARTHNGAEFSRGVATTPEDVRRIDAAFASARTGFGDRLLSDDAAADEIARRGGPKPKWCTATDCGAQIPYAAGQCADGHPAAYTNPGTYAMGSTRRPPMTILTGGRR